MDLLFPVAFGIVILFIVVGGYTFFFFHIVRSDPREIKMRDKNNESHTLFPKQHAQDLKKETRVK